MNVLQKLIKVIDYKIAEHQNALEGTELSEEALKQKLQEGLLDYHNRNPRSVLAAREIVAIKDKIWVHKGAIAALNDIKDIIEEALKNADKE